MRAEAVSNTFITQGAPLSDAACRDLQDLGWHPPTYTPSADTPHPSEGSPNFFVALSPPVAHARLAALAVRTLRTIYGIRHPEELTYKSFSWEGTAIRLPMLTIPREVAASSRSHADESPTSKKVPTAMPRSPEDVLFMRPDRRPIATEVVEADLRGRVTTCEEALQDAVWQLARFYSMVGRTREAMACVTRLLAGTEDVEKRAGGFLALGQLLEQQNRYADAAEVYSRGLDIRPAAGRTGYFLHNNRGYCLNHLGRHAEAEVHTRAALAIDPARHNAHKNLGLALVGQGRLGEAAHCLLEADRRCPEDARARRHLVELLAEHPELLVADPALAAACHAQGIRPGPVGSA
jgi:Flp pilus assembly protein TadD